MRSKRELSQNNGRGYGIYIAGTGVKVIGNSVTDSEYDGIGCELYPPSCIDVTIARNIVRGANGSGIVMGGRDSVVEGNEVYGSVSKGDQDADGIRFFGVNLTLRGNYIHVISAAGYPIGQEPHTDCFQTFDDSKPATSEVLIEGKRVRPRERAVYDCMLWRKRARSALALVTIPGFRIRRPS